MIEGFKNQSHYIYLNILSSKNRNSKQLLSNYEDNLREISEELFDIVGQLDYTPTTPYKMVKAFRSSKSPDVFKIPLLQICRRKFNGLLSYINSSLKNDS